MSVVFHVTLLNILGFVHLPEKVFNKYFEIKGVLNLMSLLHVVWGFFLGGGDGTFVRFFNFSIQ